jgi:hypothetical protein
VTADVDAAKHGDEYGHDRGSISPKGREGVTGLSRTLVELWGPIGVLGGPTE